MSIYIALPFLVPIVSSEGGVTEKIDLLPLFFLSFAITCEQRNSLGLSIHVKGKQERANSL